MSAAAGVSRPGRAATAAHLATLAGGGAVLLGLGRNQWFFYDEWNFLAGRGLGARPLDLFTPHNEHWSTIPILVYRGLFAVFGLHSYLPYLGVLVALHVALAHLLWRVALASGARPWVATALAPLGLVYGAGSGDLVWAFQIGFTGSLVLGVAAVLVLLGGATAARLVAANALLVAGLMCSGNGVTMVAIAGAVALLAWGLIPAVWTVVPPAAVYVAWYIRIGHVGQQTPLPRGSDILIVPRFAWTGMTASIDESVGVSWLGAATIAVLAALVGAALLGRERRRVAVPAAFLAGACVFFVSSGLTRWPFGADYARSSRYLLVGFVLALPALWWCASWLVARRREAIVLVAAAAILVAVHGTRTLRDSARGSASVEYDNRARILAAAGLVDGGTVILGDRPDPSVSPQLDWTEVVDLVHAGALPSGPAPSNQARMDVEAQLLVALDPAPRLAPGSGVPL
ncbi:MAG TPA: hypothetical protein VFO60_08010, partial [Candidatus Dormibacteraeota bacterium]|nr:hypothetical protein [Candidatus Dormibacteraeota bacterium]